MAKAPLGVLLLHGFTSHINCIDPVVPRLEKLQLPYRMPVLRGHGGKPSDLEGVKWQDWVEDGQKAFDDLLNDCEKVIIVGLSMGSMIAFELIRRQQEKVVALVVLVPALKVTSKLAPLAPFIAKIQKIQHFKFDPKGYFDFDQARTSQNLNDIPSTSVVEFLKFADYSRDAEKLKQIKVPILVLGASHDRTIVPAMSQFVYDNVSSRPRELVWFHGTGHEILRDAQREEVLDHIEAFLVKQIEISSQKSVASSQ